MSAPRITPSLGTGIAAALALSLGGAAVLATLGPWLGGSALRAVIAALGLAYVLYVLALSREGVGRLTTIVCWTLAASGAWALDLPLVGYVLLHVGLVWLVRSLYHYSSIVPALADLCLCLLGAAFAVWAAQRSGSAWLALWCFFLVQALHVLIPTATRRGDRDAHEPRSAAFARAHRAAEAAVRRMASATR